MPFTLSHELNPIVREYRAHLVHRDRRLAEAADAGATSARSPATCGRGLRGRAARRDLVGGSCRFDDSPSARSTRSARGRRWRRSPAAPTRQRETGSARRHRLRHRRHQLRRQPGARRRDRVHARDLAGRAVHRTHDGLSSVDVRIIGAGGGSIAWVDPGGLLRVGPQSAGADPGPACYGRGGTEPTVTDAALVLGYLDPDDFLGGAHAPRRCGRARRSGELADAARRRRRARPRARS